MSPIHERKVAEMVPILSQSECQNKVTPVTQKSCHTWQHSFDVWESRARVRLHLVHKWAGPKPLIGCAPKCSPFPPKF